MSRFASLTAGLLARKGEAEPTTTLFAEQLTRVGGPAADIQALTPMAHGSAYPRSSSIKAVESPTSFLSAFGKRLVDAAPMPARSGGDEVHDSHCGPCIGHVTEDSAKTFHVNLRLKRVRFVKLKLSAALLRRPVQDVVSEALDQWFDKLPPDVVGDCSCLKEHCE